jgi:SOS-response transcriptional repressor LexA
VTRIRETLKKHGIFALRADDKQYMDDLFPSIKTYTRQGKTVLVQLRDAADPESRERYTVKRYESEKIQSGGTGRHGRIILTSVNPKFAPIILTNADEGRLQVVAELVEALRDAQ